MNNTELRLSFSGVSVQEQGRFANSLEDYLRETVPSAAIDKQRVDESAMDIGTTLVLIVGTPAALAIAKGISAWMIRAGAPTLKIVNGPKIVEVSTDVAPSEIVEIVRAVFGS